MSEVEQNMKLHSAEKTIVAASPTPKVSRMTTPSTPPSVPPDRARGELLVRQLLAMRDALMCLSLSLKDWQFEVDLAARQAAQQQTDALLSPYRLPTKSHSKSPLAGAAPAAPQQHRPG